MLLQPEADLKTDHMQSKDADDNGIVICRSSVNMQFGEETGAAVPAVDKGVMH
jgi:hypothetical protein